MLPQPLVLGYHGCSQALARQVVNRETPLRRSANDYDWLGHGIYFWAADSVRAFGWARKRATELGQPVSDAGVVGAAIDLGNCLQLADARAGEYLREAYADLKQVSDLEDAPLPTNAGSLFSNRKLDCAVFESLHNLRARRHLLPFDTVAAYFIEGGELYPGAAVRALDHVQICVRNPTKILGYFLAHSL